MLKLVGVNSVEALITEVIPEFIRSKPLNIAAGMDEQQYLKWIKEVAEQNQVYRSFIGQGYYGTVTPGIINREVLENPGWYSQYTPYQPEISQGRLEGLLIFQTMIKDLTAMEVANASLLDEASAAAEAMQMSLRIVNKQPGDSQRKLFFIDQNCFLATIDVVTTRANYLGVEVVLGDYKTHRFDQKYIGGILQSPNSRGIISSECRNFCNQLHQVGAIATVGCDLLAATIFEAPGTLGADIVYGSSQRFGVPLFYGGPHAAFFATKLKYIREIPGRIVGVSIDRENAPAYRLALQTREQHIKRARATSNICTAQTLLALMAGFYACYHGATGLKKIAQAVHSKTLWLKKLLLEAGFAADFGYCFDTIFIDLKDSATANRIIANAKAEKINFYQVNDSQLSLSLDETVTDADLLKLAKVFGLAWQQPSVNESSPLPESLGRTTKFLEHEVFSKYQSELEMMRYLKYLENKDLSLAHSMIPLGSCTMKLNAVSMLTPVSWPELKDLHPLAPVDQAVGYKTILASLRHDLLEITGFDEVSFQPNSGAQGEFAGLCAIRQYQQASGQTQRKIALIPTSAHGTNSASAVMCGMEVVFIKCDAQGNIDLTDIAEKISTHGDKISCLMITYPSTHGVFEEEIIKITTMIHQAGGQVYMDGANMNAQVGLTNPKIIGADVCHLNLHKTFGIPHGGGGPGVGPIFTAAHLSPYLPNHHSKREKNTPPHSVAAARWGSAGILVISLGYIRMLGKEGCTKASKIAILNANYMAKRLEPHFKILYTNRQQRVAHEFIIDLRSMKKDYGVEVMDIAKRLLDYSFHPPTVSFPIAGTMMIEPTESESKGELDRFCDALIEIGKEINQIKNQQDNLLKNAPHPIKLLVKDTWSAEYSKSQAVFPNKVVQQRKFWPSTSRINEVWGDRNINCSF